MRRSGSLEETTLEQALHEAEMTRVTGSVSVSGAREGGRVWLEGGQVALASTDTQQPLATVLVESGAINEQQLADLQESTGHPAMFRAEITPEVVAVTHEVTENALARLLPLTEGTWHSKLNDSPPLGVLSTRSIDEVLKIVRLRDVVSAARDVQERGRWRLATSVNSNKVRLQGREWELLAAAAGPASPAELAQRAQWPISEVRLVLAELANRGLIERMAMPVATTPATGQATPTTPGNGPQDAPSTTDTRRSRAPAQPAPPHRQSPSPPAPESPQPARSTASAPDQPMPVGVAQVSGEGSNAWTARGGAGNDRATALRRLIGAVRRL